MTSKMFGETPTTLMSSRSERPRLETRVLSCPGFHCSAKLTQAQSSIMSFVEQNWSRTAPELIGPVSLTTLSGVPISLSRLKPIDSSSRLTAVERKMMKPREVA
eukprot:Lithocolla_globosa_v1_NODE_157_length_5627_cov_12.255922.p4 type:complete len:104 gc:universal NODE_157_length_5627_cov_12.255922:2076-1765(-)